MKNIANRGNPKAPVWVIVERPYEKDAAKGYLFSSGMGFIFDSMLKEAGLKDVYICSRAPDLEDKYSFTIIQNDINYYKPPILIPLGETGKHLCPELVDKTKKKDAQEKTNLEKYAGNLLSSTQVHYPHFVIPSFMPDEVVKDWSQRDIITSLDLGKAKQELDYWYKNNFQLQALPKRDLKYELNFEETMYWVNHFGQSRTTGDIRLLSVDIESVYTTKQSAFWPHPGYPVTIGIADSPFFGISFSLWWDTMEQNLKLWRALDELFKNPQNKFLGQNFFIFDMPRINSLGFQISENSIVDTMIRHHILWPELPHKLQFQTKQYTREPYYKDEGKQWNFKDMRKLKRYNCLDVTVTYEVYLEQEKEFAERPYLK